MKKLLAICTLFLFVGCATFDTEGQKAQTGLSDFATGDTVTAAKMNAIKNTADTADALATVNETAIAGIKDGTVAMTTPALGTPASGVGTNLTGIPASTGVTGLGTGATATIEDPLTDSSNVPTSAAIIDYGDANWGGGSYSRLFEGDTVTALTVGDATPLVATQNLYTTTGGTTITITDFVDADGDHTDFDDGDFFGVIFNDPDVTVDFSTKTHIIGNVDTNYTGSTDNPELMIFIFNGTAWRTDFNYGKATALSMGFASINLEEGTVQGSALVVSDADGIDLTIGTHNGSVILMTGAGEVGLWDCSATTIGSFVTVVNKTNANQVEVVAFGDTTNDLFRLFDGTETGANDEADLATTASAKACFMCIEANTWWVASQNGTVTDGGVAD